MALKTSTTWHESLASLSHAARSFGGGLRAFAWLHVARPGAISPRRGRKEPFSRHVLGAYDPLTSRYRSTTWCRPCWGLDACYPPKDATKMACDTL